LQLKSKYVLDISYIQKIVINKQKEQLK